METSNVEFLDDIAEFNRNMVSANENTIKQYEKWVDQYSSYKEKNNINDSLDSVRGFFSNLSKKYVGKTLWVVFSSLNW